MVLTAGTIVLLLQTGCAGESPPAPSDAAQVSALGRPEEKHLQNVRQLTFAGENAEAYFSSDDRWLIYQGHEGGDTCDQIYIMDTSGGNHRLVSTGKGRTTCGYFFPTGDRILYSSTHLGNPACPPPPDYSKGYVWPLGTAYDIFTAQPDGSDLKQLTSAPGYDAEATTSRDGKQIVFTSVRDGDLEIYTMDADGTNVRRLTHQPGYDGGAFFSYDGTQIVYRADHPTDPKEIGDFRALLADGLVRPTRLEIYVMNADGTGQRQVTQLGAASFAPYFHPDGKRVIFSSNMADPAGREFDIYMINTDGTGLERITYAEGFDGFPMFSSDGKRLVFGSNRNAAKQGDTNVFIADWVP
ncbi:MAG: PD40 domain-containing protein [Acidobacteria bacterium]|nr:PD40 domain-containing protein [Acidobacteriota bacterium]